MLVERGYGEDRRAVPVTRGTPAYISPIGPICKHPRILPLPLAAPARAARAAVLNFASKHLLHVVTLPAPRIPLSRG